MLRRTTVPACIDISSSAYQTWLGDCPLLHWNITERMCLIGIYKWWNVPLASSGDVVERSAMYIGKMSVPTSLEMLLLFTHPQCIEYSYVPWAGHALLNWKGTNKARCYQPLTKWLASPMRERWFAVLWREIITKICYFEVPAGFWNNRNSEKGSQRFFEKAQLRMLAFCWTRKRNRQTLFSPSAAAGDAKLYIT